MVAYVLSCLREGQVPITLGTNVVIDVSRKKIEDNIQLQ